MSLETAAGATVRELERDAELYGGPTTGCDWGDCDRSSVGWALECASCPDCVGTGSPFRQWLPVCRAAAIVAAETGHDVLLIGDVLQRMSSPDAVEAIADELELRYELQAAASRWLSAPAPARA